MTSQAFRSSPVVNYPSKDTASSFDWLDSSLFSDSRSNLILASPAQLRAIVLSVQSDTTPSCVYWGPHNYIVYNEPFVELIGQKHPALQGQDPSVELAEVWPYFAGLLADQRITAACHIESDHLLLLQRHNYLEETYFNWKFLPIFDADGFIVASHVTVTESTQEFLLKRRATVIHNLSRDLATATDIENFWHRCETGLLNAAEDLPMVLLYSKDQNSETCHFKCAVGIGEDLKAIGPPELSIADNDCWLSVVLRKMNGLQQPSQPILLKLSDGDIPQHIIDEVEWRGYGPPVEFVLCAICSPGSNATLAFAIFALNPRRTFGDDVRKFLHVLLQNISGPLILHYEEANRLNQLNQTQSLATEKLLDELSSKTLEYQAAEVKFERFASRAQVGFAIFSLDGRLDYANDLWRKLAEQPDKVDRIDWSSFIVEEDIDSANAAFDLMIKSGQPLSIALRFKKRWKSPNFDDNGLPVYTDTHILCNLHADPNAMGSIHTVMACLTDVTELKWNEAQSKLRMNQAILLKNQQEKFIDMTSHEMRNPLSAMLSCADIIVSALRPYVEGHDVSSAELSSSSNVKDCLEAAETIVDCALHQKRIVDDILTLSKLDSDLLVICPEQTNPIKLVSSTVKMFEAELTQHNIAFQLDVQPSLALSNINTLLFDSSRVRQILINLITNAIKFTRKEKSRKMKVSIGVSDNIMSAKDDGVIYIPKNETYRDHTNDADWMKHEFKFLHISVTDSGCGMTKREQLSLFGLFSQASPKTHVKYGGSGLGLYICRQMVEMQGGEIGVFSEYGSGSTFKFYIKTRLPRPLDSPCSELNRLSIQQIEDQTSSFSINTTSEKLEILVVEDNIINQKVIMKQLKNAGYRVEVANHGVEAIEFLKETTYWCGGSGKTRLSVVLMDLEMPVMDGMTCIKKIRDLQSDGSIIGHVPVLAVTASARRDQIGAAKSAGMDDVIIKPYRFEDMIAKIRNLLSKRRSSVTS